MATKYNRRKFLSQSLLAGMATAVSIDALACESKNVNDGKINVPLPSIKDKNILFTWGGWDGHSPKEFTDFVSAWAREQGAKVQVFDSLKPYTDKDLMSKTDLVVQCFTMSQISEQEEKGLLSAIKNGTGMAGWHGGMGDSFRNNTEYQFMTGGQWVAHPGGIIDYNVNIVNHNDEITSGIKDFSMHSEQYYMHIDPNVKVLATTTFNKKYDDWIEDCIIPVVWKKMYGKGRVFYSSLGHHLDDFKVSEAFEIVKRGICWASAGKYESPEKWVTPVYKNFKG